MTKQRMFSISSCVIVIAILAGLSLNAQAQSVDLDQPSEGISDTDLFYTSDLFLEPTDVSFGEGNQSLSVMISQNNQSGMNNSSKVEWSGMNSQDEDHRKGFFSRNKYWIIGGAATVLATSTAIIITSRGGDSGSFIPVPPGRP